MVGQCRTARRFVGRAIAIAVAAAGLAVLAPAAGAQTQMITCPTGFAPVVPPAGAIGFVPLALPKTVPNPVVPKDATGAPTPPVS